MLAAMANGKGRVPFQRFFSRVGNEKLDYFFFCFITITSVVRHSAWSAHGLGGGVNVIINTRVLFNRIKMNVMKAKKKKI